MARKKKVAFKFTAPTAAQEVKLAGNFTGWEQGAIVMKHARSGEWKADVSLEPGEYQYKFIADGSWLNDPAAEQQIGNDQGTTNSVRFVR
ncbi:MAG: isoamylase early set domain-containing protein [Candidatus Margulisbacteria bacterium]|jgi:1,4-alpha-glucan branching enzyme|nr:isoamylase early set domain-containing protein [Candidatus Margulisiibacteriota bacterium]